MVAAAARLDTIIAQIEAGLPLPATLAELRRARGLLGVLPGMTPGVKVPGDDVLAAGAKSLESVSNILQGGAGTADQIVQTRNLARTLRQWVGREPVDRIDAARRERALAIAAALRCGV